MRANLAQSIGVAGAAALLLPLAPLTTAAAVPPSPASPASSAPSPSKSSPSSSTSSGMPGHTQSLRFAGAAGESAGARAPGESGSAVRLAARTVHPYSLVGAVWDRADEALPGRIQVRTRNADTGRWSGWQALDVHPSGARGADEGSRARGATAPLWVGPSDGVEARVLPERKALRQPLPRGLRLELVDPGPDKASGPDKAPVPDKAPGSDGSADESSGADTGTEPVTGTEPGTDPGAEPKTDPGADPGTGAETGAPTAQTESGATVLPELSKEATQTRYPTSQSLVGPRPRIVTRKGWGANEKLREAGHAYTKTVKAAFVHHTAMSNVYACKQAPSIIRAMYRYHVKSSKWRDIGYNFLVDKCGTIYEGRAGGVAKPVMGAHTYGFNSNSTGIAVLGSFDKHRPSKRAVDAVAKLTAWKLGLFGVGADGKTWLKSGGGNKFRKGQKVSFHTVSGHKDGYVTDCPGARLYGKLGAIRTAAARLQGR
ncbi:N-acetylmuramoyl-L-alanine amidase [Streptomyces oryzae]|uniref:N-acetylmuramoyl-L-alanine amidase n=1 Tax=Streptomyces oryzae TaxID=1434886 RepID=A0ABS3X4X0_9ACTN|nr:peptidoglycan recognition protein [Streptomyces oryzae]MBO8190421.1 N-acetylmuramoyl-L-alanine amidase [Streptomyces oryzae]